MRRQTRKLNSEFVSDTQFVKLVSAYGGIWIPKDELNNGSRCPTCGIVFQLDVSPGKRAPRCYYCDNP